MREQNKIERINLYYSKEYEKRKKNKIGTFRTLFFFKWSTSNYDLLPSLFVDINVNYIGYVLINKYN